MRVRLQVTRNTLGFELCTDRYAVQFLLCGTPFSSTIMTPQNYPGKAHHCSPVKARYVVPFVITYSEQKSALVIVTIYVAYVMIYRFVTGLHCNICHYLIRRWIIFNAIIGSTAQCVFNSNTLDISHKMFEIIFLKQRLLFKGPIS